MGTVWLVRHIELDSPRALKLINEEVAADPQVRARFRREARLMAGFRHPCAVTVHDASVGPGGAFIEMEYLEGRDFKSLMTPGRPMPRDWTERVLGQLCDVLQALHDRGIIHRDLKPSNLMLLDGRPPGAEAVKLLDLGIAKILEPDEGSEGHLTRSGFAPFTPLYASPEQLSLGPVDARSDIYSLGVILYEMLTGYTPFSGAKVLSDHLTAQPPRFRERNPDVRAPAGLESLVHRCLAKNPDDRPQSAEELYREFLGAVEPSVTVPDQSPATPRRAARPWVWVALGLALAAGAGLGGVAWTRRGAVPAGFYADGWLGGRPSALVRERDGARFVRSDRGDYLAAGYEPVGDARRNNWPEVVRRQSDGARFHLAREGSYLPENYRQASGAVIIRGDGRRFVLIGDSYDEGVAGFYLPEGYDEEGVGSPVAAIVRKADGARFVWVEGGEFQLGALRKPTGRPEDDEDQPPHPVAVSGFYMQQTEVTNGQMAAFLRDVGLDPADEAPGYLLAVSDLAKARKPAEVATHPAAGIPYRLAARYADWAGGRLPTEAEWEYAARSKGRTDRPYVWGDDELRPADVELRKVNIHWSGRDLPTTPVGSSPLDRTAQGVADLAGNVREWCLDVFARYPPAAAGMLLDPRNVRPEGEPVEHVLRGGSFETPAERALTTHPRRLRGVETDRDGVKIDTARDVGFRIVIEPVRVPGSAW
jgi:serine/threonine-protein kinase